MENTSTARGPSGLCAVEVFLLLHYAFQISSSKSCARDRPLMGISIS